MVNSTKKTFHRQERLLKTTSLDFVCSVLRKSIKIVSCGLSNYKYNVRDELRNMEPEEIKEICSKKSLGHVLMCLNPDQDLNIGSMIRTSHLLGFSKVIIVGNRHYNRKSAVGSYGYIDIERYKCDLIEGCFHTIDNEKAIDLIKSFEEDYQIVFVEQDENSVDLRKVEKTWEKPLLIVMGSKSSGIPKQILRSFEKSIIVEIPQRGATRSFNVGVAFGIVASYLMLSEV